jgi:hypothetical protein
MVHITHLHTHTHTHTHTHFLLTSEHLHQHGCVTVYIVNPLPARCFLRKALGPYNHTLVAHYDWEVMNCPASCPSLAPGPLKKHLAGKYFAPDADVNWSLTAWLRFTLTSAMPGYKPEWWSRTNLQIVAVWKCDVYHLVCVVCTLKSEYSSGHQSVLYLIFKIFLYVIIILDFIILESVTLVMMVGWIDVCIV